MRIERQMLQEATHEKCHLVSPNCQLHQAIAGMTKLTGVEVIVASEEGRATHSKQKCYDLVVLHTAPPDIEPDLAYANEPTDE